jgi:hypothetical protein
MVFDGDCQASNRVKRRGRELTCQHNILNTTPIMQSYGVLVQQVLSIFDYVTAHGYIGGKL